MRISTSFLNAWSSLPQARGAGMFAAQADSFLDSVAHHDGQARTNPPGAAASVADAVEREQGADVESGKSDPNMRRGDLMEIAALITGKYAGMSTIPGAAVGGSAIKIPQDMAERLSILDGMLRRHIDRIRAKSPRSTWPKSLTKLHHAVVSTLRGRPLFQEVSRGRKGTAALPFGLAWGILANNGNKKLPFVAYSELPVVSCPGAGACIQWCYSLKAWRYPDAFVRQALNSLAARVDQAINPAMGARQWPTYCLGAAVGASKRKLAEKTVFFRLFVDGDFYSQDNVVAWNDALRLVTPGGSLIKTIVRKPVAHGIEAYGYSKCWDFFINLHAKGYTFAPNYVVNASSGSRYATKPGMLQSMLALPVVRGEFRAIPIGAYLTELDSVLKGGSIQPKVSDAAAKGRIGQFLELHAINDAASAFDAANYLADKMGITGLKSMPADARTLGNIRARIFKNWIASLGKDKTLYGEAVAEIAADNGVSVSVQRRKGVSKKQLQDKMLALRLHEVLWAFGLGGSCPLVCGNCSDNFENKAAGVHRCAAKPGSLFWKTPIHIGLH
jgi:hypothetical protein